MRPSAEELSSRRSCYPARNENPTLWPVMGLNLAAFTTRGCSISATWDVCASFLPRAPAGTQQQPSAPSISPQHPAAALSTHPAAALNTQQPLPASPVTQTAWLATDMFQSCFVIMTAALACVGLNAIVCVAAQHTQVQVAHAVVAACSARPRHAPVSCKVGAAQHRGGRAAPKPRRPRTSTASSSSSIRRRLAGMHHCTKERE